MKEVLTKKRRRIIIELGEEHERMLEEIAKGKYRGAKYSQVVRWLIEDSFNSKLVEGFVR